MNPQDAAAPPADAPVAHDPLDAGQSSEQVICTIKRHPIGIVTVYAAAGLLLLVTAVLAFIVAPGVSSDPGHTALIGGLAFIAVACIVTVYVFVARRVYSDNEWIVTSNNVTQIRRTGLFDREVSQLSFGDLEDLTAAQDGILADLFHYGVLSAETAAATDKFTFSYCPRPNEYAKQILAAREQFEANRRQAPATETDYSAPDQTDSAR